MQPIEEREMRIDSLKRTADRLAFELEALATESPNAKTRALIDALLKSKELDRFLNSSGISCRAGVVHALLAMGFPHAMEVSADDLRLTRIEKPVPTGIQGTIGVRLLAAVSGLWNALFALVAFFLSDDKYHLDLWGMFAGGAFVVAAAHAVAAFIALTVVPRTSTREFRRSLRRNLQLLSWMFLLGPATAGIASVVRGVDVVPIAFLLALPFMVTCAGVVYHASEIPDEG